MTIELCLFRHGRTTWNLEGRYQGHADVDLDELGRGQALAVAERCREIAPVAVFSSDLRRCADVGRRVSEATGVSLQLDERLRERDVGSWSGLTRVEIGEQFPEEFAAWRAGDDRLRPGGGESHSDVARRIDSFCADAKAGQQSGSIVVITHAGWIRSAIQSAFGATFGRNRLGVATQGSLTVLILDDNGSVGLEAFNDRGHLLNVQPVDRQPPAPLVY